MKHFLYILIIIFLTVGCKISSTDRANNPIDTLRIQGNTQMVSYSDTIYKSDDITVELKNNDYEFSVLLTNGNFREEYNLYELNIPTKTPEIVWVNDEYICMITWWSQAQSRYIFIPTKRTNKFIYFDKDIEETDSINNNIVYVDSVFERKNKIVFKVENLLTRKSKSLDFPIDEQNSVYPFYDKIILTKNKLTMTNATKMKNIDIKEINNGW